MITKVLTLTVAIDYIMLNNLNIFVLLLNLIKDENTFKGVKGCQGIDMTALAHCCKSSVSGWGIGFHFKYFNMLTKK